jgi:LuxR family maltose regulon positive regulatory protein
LLAEWLEARAPAGRSVAWVSLEESDNDAARFLAYLVGALRTVERDIGKGVLASLRSPEFPSVEAVVGALEMAREAERVARGSGAAPEIAIAGAWMTRLRIARGDLTEPAVLDQERGANAHAAAPDGVRMVNRITAARLLHARGRHHEALALLEELREAAEQSGRTGDLVEIQALRAAGEKERAVRTLTRALAAAEPEGYVRTFADEGAAMGDLLSEVLKVRERSSLGAADRVEARYLAKLLAALPRGAAPTAVRGPLAERPSERELEVLALIAAGETNAEIARKLFVSTSTVKTHINNLYRKLGARGRVQAVVRARELGLI